MQTQAVHIRIQDGQIKMKLNNIQNFPTLLLALLTAMLSSAQTIAKQHPHLIPEMYDMINMGASNVLSALDPEAQLRPTLTEAAILRAENEIMQEVTDKYGQEEMQAQA